MYHIGLRSEIRDIMDNNDDSDHGSKLAWAFEGEEQTALASVYEAYAYHLSTQFSALFSTLLRMRKSLNRTQQIYSVYWLGCWLFAKSIRLGPFLCWKNTYLSFKTIRSQFFQLICLV